MWNRSGLHGSKDRHEDQYRCRHEHNKQDYIQEVIQPSTVILKNFDSNYIQPMGKFKAFLCWKGKRYRVDIKVMDSNTTPNMLSRESTFCMGILKPCFVLKKSTRKEDTPSTTTDTPSATTATPSRTMDNSHPWQQPRSPVPYNINGKVNLKKPLTEQFIKSEFFTSDVFQKKLDSIYIGLPGVTGITDDMIIYRTTKDEHDQNLLRFLQVTKDKGLRLNKDKIQCKKTEVSFFGHR